jgi:hypothetical protein
MASQFSWFKYNSALLVLYKDKNNKKEGYYFRCRAASGIGEVLGRAFVIEDSSLD